MLGGTFLYCVATRRALLALVTLVAAGGYTYYRYASQGGDRQEAVHVANSQPAAAAAAKAPSPVEVRWRVIDLLEAGKKT